MVRYRQALVLSFFFKFFLSATQQLKGSVLPTEISATESFQKKPICSHQLYEVRESGVENDVVGKPIKHKAADSQVSGSAVYTDDMRKFTGELYLAFVTSSRAHARLVSIDPTFALAMDGV